MQVTGISSFEKFSDNVTLMTNFTFRLYLSLFNHALFHNRHTESGTVMDKQLLCLVNMVYCILVSVSKCPTNTVIILLHAQAFDFIRALGLFLISIPKAIGPHLQSG